VNSVILNPRGVIQVDGNPVESDALRVLGFQVELAENFTLRSYFRLIENYKELSKLSEFFPVCFERYHASPKEGCVFPGMEYLELSRTIEMIGFPGQPRVEIYNSFHGVQGGERCSLEPIQWENVLDVPVRLGKLKHMVLGDEVDTLECETVCSLFEFIDGIVWELSFHGNPSQCSIEG